MARMPAHTPLQGFTYQPGLDAAALDAVRMQQEAPRKRLGRGLKPRFVRLLRPLLAGVGDLLIVLGCRLKGSVGSSVPLQSLAQLHLAPPPFSRRGSPRP